LRRKIIVALLSVTVALATTASAFAHDCFNPNTPAGAGVNYTIVGFDQNGPIFEQTGPGKGIGGFAAIAPGVVGNETTIEAHTIGNSSSKEEVGGPGSAKPDHACDGKGIDYLSACAGAPE
jgi:hypothetical protein